MIKGAIFDLDMSILNTHSVGEDAMRPVLNVLQNSSLDEDLKKQVYERLWNTSLEDIVELYKVPEDVAEGMREAYRDLEAPDGIKSFGDEQCIEKLPIKKYLVTSGFRKLQQSKIDKLGIADLFDEIVIDALDVREERKGKTNIFKEIMQENRWQAPEVLVVGDNPDSELSVGHKLGMPTAQTLRPTVIRWPDATHHISSLCELSEILKTG